MIQKASFLHINAQNFIKVNSNLKEGKDKFFINFETLCTVRKSLIFRFHQQIMFPNFIFKFSKIFFSLFDFS